MKKYKAFTIAEGATHVAPCDSVGSFFRHWYGAFTLAEVLITLGIIGVVAAMTMPALIAYNGWKIPKDFPVKMKY